MIEDISPAVRNINVPTLVLAGENDQVERVETLKQELIPRIPDVQMRVIPRSGHLSLLEVPDEIATGIRNFLITLRPEIGKTQARAGHANAFRIRLAWPTAL
jgi:pimeloyl-ACP methyl ester carboxylesterase